MALQSVLSLWPLPNCILPLPNCTLPSVLSSMVPSCPEIRMLQGRDSSTMMTSTVIISLYLASKDYVWFSKLWDLWMKDALSSTKQFSLPQTKMKPRAPHVSSGPSLLCHFPFAIFSFQTLTFWQPSYFQKLLSEFEIMILLLGLFSKQAFHYLNFSKLPSRFLDAALFFFFFAIKQTVNFTMLTSHLSHFLKYSSESDFSTFASICWAFYKIMTNFFLTLNNTFFGCSKFTQGFLMLLLIPRCPKLSIYRKACYEFCPSNYSSKSNGTWLPNCFQGWRVSFASR